MGYIKVHAHVAIRTRGMKRARKNLNKKACAYLNTKFVPYEGQPLAILSPATLPHKQNPYIILILNPLCRHLPGTQVKFMTRYPSFFKE